MAGRFGSLSGKFLSLLCVQTYYSELMQHRSGNVSAIIFTYLMCPETQGKTLEQVDYLFVDRALAGLRRNSVTDLETIESRMANNAHLRRKSVGSTEAIEEKTKV